MPRVTTTIEVSFEMADPDTYETAQTWREAVEQELGGVSVSTYDEYPMCTLSGPGDPGFRFEGAELDDLIPRPMDWEDDK